MESSVPQELLAVHHCVSVCPKLKTNDSDCTDGYGAPRPYLYLPSGSHPIWRNICFNSLDISTTAKRATSTYDLPALFIWMVPRPVAQYVLLMGIYTYKRRREGMGRRALPHIDNYELAEPSIVKL